MESRVHVSLARSGLQAQLAEVLCRLGRHISLELNHDTAYLDRIGAASEPALDAPLSSCRRPVMAHEINLRQSSEQARHMRLLDRSKGCFGAAAEWRVERVVVGRT